MLVDSWKKELESAIHVGSEESYCLHWLAVSAVICLIIERVVSVEPSRASVTSLIAYTSTTLHVVHSRGDSTVVQHTGESAVRYRPPQFSVLVSDVTLAAY